MVKTPNPHKLQPPVNPPNSFNPEGCDVVGGWILEEGEGLLMNEDTKRDR